MKIKRKWASLLAFFSLLLKAKAVQLVGIVMAITIIIVGGIIVYKLIQFFHSPAWQNIPGSTTNTVSSVSITIDYVPPGYPIATQSIYGYLYPTPVDLATNSIYGDDLEEVDGVPGFTFQYGLDVNSNPIVSMNGQPVATEQSFALTGNDFNFQFNVNLGGYNDVITYSSTNMENTNDTAEMDLTSTGPGSVTNAYGDTASDTAGGTQSINAVIIQRSFDLMNWTNIFTNNAMSPGNLQYYTDTNIVWPSYSTFYNTNTGGGGGGMSPDTNSASTNGVITVPAGAYYRLAYPSNQTYYLTN